ncbi:hypothetical protein CTEN210_10093 [Chaetoceros tenuissimus]|uniref:Protein kinase domain-containing protein n=1 Tax=Chaetoceros tenuissimus TaxID=426638 RepID=A0AAD3CX24_9STRA|nr:hypothetical protein CTEN210_10093 [Chaetoceros tenuissimus]
MTREGAEMDAILASEHMFKSRNSSGNNHCKVKTSTANLILLVSVITFAISNYVTVAATMNFDEVITERSALKLEYTPLPDLKQHPMIIQYDDPLQPPTPIQEKYDHKSYTISTWTEYSEVKQKQLWNDTIYDSDEWIVEPPYHDMPECKQMYEWQSKIFPTCNVVHAGSMHDSLVQNHAKYLAHGAFRATFRMDDYDNSPMAFKTFHGHHTTDQEFLHVMEDEEYLYTPKYYDRHRIDALVYERMTSSDLIMDIYGYCGFAGFFEFANGKTLRDLVKEAEDKGMSHKKKLGLAVEVASAVTDLHTIESKNGYSSFIHGDLSPTQFVQVGKRLKLNDFNRAHLLYWDEEKQKTCKYAWDDGHMGARRAPEEYKVEPFSDSIDVYTLGMLMYLIVFGKEPYSDFEEKSRKLRRVIRKGAVPTIPQDFIDSNHPVDKAFFKAMNMCNSRDPDKRAKASEVRDYLKKKYKKRYAKH